MSEPTTAHRPGPPPPAHDALLPAAFVMTSGVRFLGGAAYADLPGMRPLELDLWLPAQADVSPVVVFLHGGGWRLGSRRSAGPAYTGAAVGPFEQMALAGIAVASIDYRLSGEAQWPAQLHDAKAAVRWLRARADALGVDPDRIAAWGESAGGQLAEMLGLTGCRDTENDGTENDGTENDGTQNAGTGNDGTGHDRTGNEDPGNDGSLEGTVGVTGPSSAVVAVAAWYAPSDIAAVATDNGQEVTDPNTREAQLLGAPAAIVPDIAVTASPLAQVTTDAPPFLLLHGACDRLIPAVQSVRLHAALLAAGVSAELHLYDGADHMWRGAPVAAEDAVRRTIAFLRYHLGLADSPRRAGAA